MRQGMLKATLAMAGIFLAGAVAGGFAGVAWWRSQIPGRLAEQQIKRMTDELKLSSEQQRRIHAIMADSADDLRAAYTQVRKVRAEMNGRIRGELTSEQRDRFETLLERRRPRSEWPGPRPDGAPPEKSAPSNPPKESSGSL